LVACIARPCHGRTQHALPPRVPPREPMAASPRHALLFEQTRLEAALDVCLLPGAGHDAAQHSRRDNGEDEDMRALLDGRWWEPSRLDQRRPGQTLRYSANMAEIVVSWCGVDQEFLCLRVLCVCVCEREREREREREKGGRREREREIRRGSEEEREGVKKKKNRERERERERLGAKEERREGLGEKRGRKREREGERRRKRKGEMEREGGGSRMSAD
jgi:hypothetical protein